MTFDTQPDDQNPIGEDATGRDAYRDTYREAIREASGVAIRSACCWVPIAGAILIAGLYAEQKPFIAADKILTDKAGDFWQQAFMPVILFAIFGGLFGLFIGWRMANTCGMVGWPAWIIGAGATLALAVIGLVGAFFIFPAGIAMMAWLSLALMIVAGLAGVSYYTLWAH